MDVRPDLLVFEAERDRLSRLLGVLQSIEGAPAPLLMMHPEGALGTARSGMILSEVTPAVAEEARALRGQLQELATLRALQDGALSQLTTALERAQDARSALSQAIADRIQNAVAERLGDGDALAHLRWREAYTHRWFCQYAEAHQAAEVAIDERLARALPSAGDNVACCDAGHLMRRLRTRFTSATMLSSRASPVSWWIMTRRTGSSRSPTKSGWISHDGRAPAMVGQTSRMCAPSTEVASAPKS